jgi:hypothetical protein
MVAELTIGFFRYRWLGLILKFSHALRAMSLACRVVSRRVMVYYTTINWPHTHMLGSSGSVRSNIRAAYCGPVSVGVGYASAGR